MGGWMGYNILCFITIFLWTWKLIGKALLGNLLIKSTILHVRGVVYYFVLYLPLLGIAHTWGRACWIFPFGHNMSRTPWPASRSSWTCSWGSNGSRTSTRTPSRGWSPPRRRTFCGTDRIFPFYDNRWNSGRFPRVPTSFFVVFDPCRRGWDHGGPQKRTNCVESGPYC